MPATAPTATDPDAEQQALQDAVAGLMASVARLAVARGLPYPVLEEMLKQACVQAADRAHPGLLAHRKVSRISTSTGINRREVTRLVQAQPRAVARTRSLASELFAHWRTQRPYRGRDGQPQVLPRLGPEPSFETLAQTVTRDVHPRSLLDELVRLGLAQWDEADDTVSLAREAFVPQGDRVRMLGFLGDNVGDHLRAAVDNVLLDNRAHFEQAVFADGLSAQSLAAMRPAIREQWQAVLAALVPALEARVEADAPTHSDGRLRVGLYSYQEGAQAPAPSPPAAPRRAPRKR
jgi:hypothetical protein